MTPVAFLFPGLGEHYPGMGRGLYESEPVFRSCVDDCCERLQPLLGVDLRSLLYPPPQTASAPATTSGTDLRKLLRRNADPAPAGERLDQTWLAQPALFVTEYALTRLLLERGILPDIMIGYSLGEYVAACVAGVFSLEDSLTLVARRGLMIQELPAGAMAAVPLGEREIVPYLDDAVSLSAVNGPAVSVVSGTPDGIAALEERLMRDGIATMRVRTTHAFHSFLMEPLAAAYTSLVAGFRLSPPRIPFISNVTGRRIDPEEAVDPAYWAKHLVQAVRFSDGIGELLREPELTIIEAGPGSTLGSFVLAHPAGAQRRVRRSMRGRIEQASDTAVFDEACKQQIQTAVSDGSYTQTESATFSDTEARLAKIWARFFPSADLRPDHDFFQLGGNSLLASQLVYRILKEFRVTLKLRKIYEAPTLAALARELESASVTAPARTKTIDPPVMRLPNGLTVHYRHEAEALQFYRDIFEHRAYVDKGVSLPEDAVVFDVGANIGLFTLFCHLERPGARIFSFEPAPPIFGILQRNADLHRIPAKLLRAGISDRNGSARLTYYPLSSGMSSFHADTEEEKQVLETIIHNQVRLGMTAAGDLPVDLGDMLSLRFESSSFDCELRTLSSVIAENGIDRIDLLKVDVQKCELEVLRGLLPSDWDKVRQIVLEVHDIGGRLDEIAALLRRQGFTISSEQDELYRGTSIHNVWAIKEQVALAAS